MVKIPQTTTSNDEVSLSQHPHYQCKTLWPWIKWMLVYFHSNIHISVIPMFCKSSVSGSCVCTLHLLTHPCFLHIFVVPKLGICQILRLGKPNLEFQVWAPILKLGKPNLESAMLPNLKIGQLHNLKIGLPKLGMLND